MNQLELFPETFVDVRITPLWEPAGIGLSIQGPNVTIQAYGQSISDILHHSPNWANHIRKVHHQGAEQMDILLPETVWIYWRKQSTWSSRTYFYKA